MFVFCGLGNPGKDYALNRHNIGFLAAETLHRRHGFSPWKSKFQSELSEGRIGSEKVLLVKPQTYMNNSGQALSSIQQFYKLKPEQILIAYDELDLAPGKTRLKTGGGHGGHNGIRSAMQHIGVNFRRLRIGIGHPGHKDAVTAWVLGDFSKAEREWMGPLLEAISDHADLLIAKNDSEFSNKVHLATADLLPADKKKEPKSNTDPAPFSQAPSSQKPTVAATTQRKDKPASTTGTALGDGLMKLFGSKRGDT